MTPVRGNLSRAIRAGAGLVVCVGLANCSATDKFARKVDPKYGVSASPRVVSLDERAPKGGGVFRVGKPYVVGGRTFVPEDNTNYRSEGLASWYGKDFHGRLTANGEVFDLESISAAHPTLPLPSYVRVTNMANKRSLIVRVNDRGPFHGNRVIDLSQKSAHLLGFKDHGVARVKVEYVGRASLDGSDDTRLMATLRQGEPAPAPVQVASAGNIRMPAASRAAFDEAVPVPASRPYNLGEPVSGRITDATAAERAPRQVVAESSRMAVPATTPVRYDNRVGYLSGRGLY